MNNSVQDAKEEYANFARGLFTLATKRLDELRDEYRQKFTELPGVRRIDMGFGVYYEMPNFDFTHPESKK